MPIVYRANNDRLTLGEAKRLILDAVPREASVDVYIRPDGTTKVVPNESSNLHAPWIDDDFPGTCEQLSITPRRKYRPSKTGYAGDTAQDELYTIAHDEFVRIAGLFGLVVALGDSLHPPMHVVDAAYLLAGLARPDSLMSGISKAPASVRDVLLFIEGETGAVRLATMPEQRSTITHAEFEALKAKFPVQVQSQMTTVPNLATPEKRGEELPTDRKEKQVVLLEMFRRFGGKRSGEAEKGERGALARLSEKTGIHTKNLGVALDKAIDEERRAAQWAQLGRR